MDGGIALLSDIGLVECQELPGKYGPVGVLPKDIGAGSLWFDSKSDTRSSKTRHCYILSSE